MAHMSYIQYFRTEQMDMGSLLGTEVGDYTKLQEGPLCELIISS